MRKIHRILVIALLALTFLSCHDYVWQGDFVASVGEGVSEVWVVGRTVSVLSDQYGYCVPGMTNTITLEVRNPDELNLLAELVPSNASLVSTPVATKLDSRHFAFAFTVDDLALDVPLSFRLSLSAPGSGREFQDYNFSLACHYPGTMGPDVTLTLPDALSNVLVFSPSTLTVSQADSTVSFASDASAALSASAVWTWYVDGSLAGSSASATGSFDFDPSAETAGDHILSVTAEDAGAIYSASMTITVVSAVTPKYSVAYDMAGGSASQAAVSYNTGATVTAAATAGTRTGYAFDHWSTHDVDAGGAETTYIGSGSFFMPARNVLLTAVWTFTYGAPTSLSVSAASGQLGLTWTDPDSPELSYIVVKWYPTGDVSSAVVASVVPGQQGLLLTGLTDGQEYTIEVTAVYSDAGSSSVASTAGTPGN